jgi:hypothetical protein
LTTAISRDANFETVDGMATPIDVVPWREGTIGARPHQRSTALSASAPGLWKRFSMTIARGMAPVP